MTTVSTTSELAEEHTDQPLLQSFGRAKLADFFGDLVIYRNLEPLDRRLKGLKTSSHKMNVLPDRVPRKQDPEYAKAAVWFAEQAQKLRRGAPKLSEILFLGDTLYNDGQAYHNMREHSSWQGSCFIGADRPAEAPALHHLENEIVSANRWTFMRDWVAHMLDQGLHLDKRTVAIVDIDKTALGAKGRNDHVIDAARLEGIFRTMDDVLGDDFNRADFEKQYAELNRSRYHFLTEDNQDYLAYICLVLNTRLIDYKDMLGEIESKSLDSFEQFLRWVDSRMMINPLSGESLRQVHEAVVTSVRNGDPTPFKRFRRQEFITTVERMGNLSDDVGVDELLAQEITLTQEVCELTEWLRERGCLLLCLSDKPDEASCPDRYAPPDLLPVHMTETHRVGTSLRAALDALG
ncbi:MAG: hypothetical protein WDZ49_12105 [Litorilinea sp.]